MIYRFDPARRAIYVGVVLEGPRQRYETIFLLDTGASRTIVSSALLGFIGCRHEARGPTAVMSSLTDLVRVPLIVVPRLHSLGVSCQNLEVASHILPAPSRIMGMLGCDFFEGRKLTINFKRGTITLRD